MPIYKGNTNIVGIYKGVNEIVKRYKGTDIIYEAFKWLPYSYENLYYGLVPTTIDSKSVKNKARVEKVYGNSVVENQLVVNGNFEDTSGWAFGSYTTQNITANNNILTITNTNEETAPYKCVQRVVELVNGHKYLIVGQKYSSQTRALQSIGIYGATTSSFQAYNNANIWTFIWGFAQATMTGNGLIQLFGFSDTASIPNNATAQFKSVRVFDLTQMFPFDTPTTLTDTRVQALLNRGYIPYNTGEIKSVDIGEISSESYNIWDEQWELGTYNTTTGAKQNSSTQIRCKNFIKVIPGQTYSFESPLPNRNDVAAVFYDGNYNILKSDTINNQTFTIPNNCGYITFYVGSGYGTTYKNDVCFHLTGTRTGYAPYQSFSPISFKYQGSGVGTSHDTLERTDTEWVFTKNNAILDLGTLTFGGIGNNVYYATLSTAKNNTGQGNMPNIICNKYQTISAITGSSWNSETRDKIISLGYDTARVYLRDTSISQASDIVGILAYELATPQVIRIPRKRLGVVDLGSLTWTAPNENRTSTFSLTDILSNTTNIYCSKYISSSIMGTTETGKIAVLNQNVFIADSNFNGKTVDEIKTLLSGTYLFYETNTEVEDMPFLLGIESGGTINANLFSWVENQIVPINRIIATTTNNGITFTNNGDGTLTLNGTATADIYQSFEIGQQSITIGHKYLVSGFDGINTFFSISNNGETKNSAFISGSAIYNATYCEMRIKNGTAFNNKKIYLNFIDLTLGELNDVSSIDDTRIQYILQKGYIPTDTTGTYENVPCEVLPNIDFEMKAK